MKDFIWKYAFAIIAWCAVVMFLGEGNWWAAAWAGIAVFNNITIVMMRQVAELQDELIAEYKADLDLILTKLKEVGNEQR